MCVSVYKTFFLLYCLVNDVRSHGVILFMAGYNNY